MALLSALLSLVARQLSTILQAIFGWSVTALFGKLASRMQTTLLLRGDPHRVARVRASRTRTDLEACAYLVQSADAKKIQDEVGQLPAADLARQLEHAPISFEEWTVLETFLRRPAAVSTHAA
jgi:hypothetical protein